MRKVTIILLSVLGACMMLVVCVRNMAQGGGITDCKLINDCDVSTGGNGNCSII